jgi:hypothetical protein
MQDNHLHTKTLQMDAFRLYANYRQPFTYTIQRNGQSPYIANARGPFTYNARYPSTYQARSPSIGNARSPSIGNAEGFFQFSYYFSGGGGGGGRLPESL